MHNRCGLVHGGIGEIVYDVYLEVITYVPGNEWTRKLLVCNCSSVCHHQPFFSFGFDEPGLTSE